MFGNVFIPTHVRCSRQNITSSYKVLPARDLKTYAGMEL